MTLDGVHVRGVEKVRAHAYINAVVLMASALAMHRVNRIKQVS
ncbi:transposase IS4 family protein [Alicyclobacillus hesperidum URH17-3-68]|nr:transposase IS4 family protein [Alicyclobacillus hesperidum URH17-3-68]